MSKSKIFVHGTTGKPYMSAPDPENIGDFVTVEMEAGKEYGDYLGLMYDFPSETWVEDVDYQNSRKAALAATDGDSGMVKVDSIKLPIDGPSRQRMMEILAVNENPDSNWQLVGHTGELVTVTRDQIRRALLLAVKKYQDALEAVYTPS